MLDMRHTGVRLLACLSFLLSSDAKAQTCYQMSVAPALQKVKTLQSQLLAYKLHDEMDEGVPRTLQILIRNFKEALAKLADAEVQCAAASLDPKAVESSLAIMLDANKPVQQDNDDPNKPPQLDQIYASSIGVKVTAPTAKPHLVLIELSFAIACGSDTLLLAYEPRSDRWDRVLRWQSGDYSEVDKAFGDFFNYVVIPNSNNQGWLLAVAHGSPWCTSRWSGYDLDLLQPSSTASTQKVLQHISKGYIRFEVEPVMKPEPKGFQLRLQTGMIDTDLMTRIGIYRYRVSENHLERVQPIANNGRDFVDEWLQSPWSDSAKWSASSSLAQLKQTHTAIQTANKSEASSAPIFTFGPVQTCSDGKSHFQVELDKKWRNSKGKSRSGNPTFFQIMQGKNSFTMQSASTVSDTHCTGADIMVKPQAANIDQPQR